MNEQDIMPAPRMDPNCRCICHTQPGVMHVAACCAAPAPGADAMSAGDVQKVPVKQLAWKPRKNFDGDWVAKTPFGQYSVGCIHGDWMWFFEYLQDGVDKTAKGRRATEGGAKAAAQADYEARILAALDDDALAKLIAEARAEGMERAAEIYADGEGWDYFGAAYDAIRAEAAEAERDAALAMGAGAYEAAAHRIRTEGPKSPYYCGMTVIYQRGLGDGFEAAAQLVTEATPADAKAALDRLLDAARAEERERAARVADEAAAICLADARKADEVGHDSCADQDRQAAHICRGVAAAIREART